MLPDLKLPRIRKPVDLGKTLDIPAKIMRDAPECFASLHLIVRTMNLRNRRWNRSPDEGRVGRTAHRKYTEDAVSCEFHRATLQFPSPTDYAKRVAGIEPAWPAWEAGALPLCYTRVAAAVKRGPLPRRENLGFPF